MSSLLILIVPHILLPLSMILSLASPPFYHRDIFCTLLILSLAYLTLTSDFPHDTQFRYGISNSWFYYLPTIQKLLFSTTTPEKAYWRLDHQEAEATHMPFGLEKLRWAVALWINPRGVGWNYQMRRLPPHKYAEDRRWKFVSLQLLDFLRHYLVLEAMILYLGKRVPSGTLDGMTWGQYLPVGIASGILIYSSWQLQWTFASVVGVASGLSKPADWPPFFGSILDVTSVAHFWGSFWQQVLHRSLLGYSKALIQALRIPQHTLVAYFVHLSVGFLLSGIMHAVSLSSLSSDLPLYVIFEKNTIFFIGQIVGICVEQGVARWYKSQASATAGDREVQNGKEGGNRIAIRVCGYIWVISWLLYSGRGFLDNYFRVGMTTWKVPFPVLERFVGQTAQAES